MNIPGRLRVPSVAQNAWFWFEKREYREQVLLVCLAAFAALAILLVAVWRPLGEQRAAALKTVADYETLMAKVRAAGPNLDSRLAGAAPLTIADSAAANGLVIRRLEPEGERTRVSLDDAEFARVISWIAQLENEGAFLLVSIEIERRPAPGVVNARITLEK